MLAELIVAFVGIAWCTRYGEHADAGQILPMANSTAEFTPPPATYAS